ncbi:hypothetical protein [Salmonella enterica]|uniref:hypothetical protein n=1 Tax=Salmonella enterica TaxID=28901 RepID=UPI003C6E183B
MLSDDGFILFNAMIMNQHILKFYVIQFLEKNYRNSIYWHRTYAGKTVKSKLPWNRYNIVLF